MSRPVPRVLTGAAILAALFATVPVVAAETAAPNAAAAAAPGAARAENAYLTREEAMKRSARVSNVAYTLEFELTGKETFGGTSTIAFDLKDADTPLTIDLNKGTIVALTVNGKSVTPQYNNWFITIAAKGLLAGQLELERVRNVRHPRRALHRFLARQVGIFSARGAGGGSGGGIRGGRFGGNNGGDGGKQGSQDGGASQYAWNGTAHEHSYDYIRSTISPLLFLVEKFVVS